MLRTLALAALVVSLAACPGPGPVPNGPDVPVHPPDAAVLEPDVVLPDAGQPDAGQPDAGEPVVDLPDAGPLDAGVPFLRLGGPLEVVAGTVPTADLRVAMLWFPSLDPASPRPFAAVEVGPALGALPSSWRLDVTLEPPASARQAVSSASGGTGEVSYGALVLWRDGDGDGTLTLGAGGSADEVLGSSVGAGPFDAERLAPRTFVVWRKGALGSDESDLIEGFNLVTSSAPFERPRPVVTSPLDVTLRHSAESRLALLLCGDAFASEVPEYACGQLVFRTPRVTGLASSFEDDLMILDVSVFGGARQITDAQVFINDEAVPLGPGGGYALFEVLPAKLLRQGQNTLQVQAPGYEPLTLDLFFPEKPTLLAPLANAQVPVSSQTVVSWAAVPHATKYTASLRGPLGTWGFAITDLTQASLVAPSNVGPGELTLEVEAKTLAPRHALVGTSKTEVPVTLVP